MKNKLITDYFNDIYRFIKKIKKNRNCKTDINFKLKLSDNLSRAELNPVVYLDFSKERKKYTIEQINKFITDLGDVFSESEDDFAVWNEGLFEVKKDIYEGKIFTCYPERIVSDEDYKNINDNLLWLIVSRVEYVRKIFEPSEFKKSLKVTLKQQILLLDYLGVLEVKGNIRTRFETNNDFYYYLSFLLNADISHIKNVVTNIEGKSKYNPYRNIDDLKKVRDIFSKVNLKKIVSDIDLKIKKLEYTNSM